MQEFESKCIQTSEEYYNFIEEFTETIQFVHILKHPKPLSTLSSIMADFCKSPQNSNDTLNCIGIELFHCIDLISSKSCANHMNATVDSYTDNFIADVISIQFHHNFTNILNCSVYFVYHKLLTEDSVMADILQTIRVEYFESNETYSTKNAHQISGNIGYLDHKPLIITKYLQINDSATDEKQTIRRILEYFHENATCSNHAHSIKLPTIESNGDCMLNNQTYNTINFGENIRLKCNSVLSSSTNDTFTADDDQNQNYTMICRSFQQSIFNSLLYGFELETPNATIYDKFNVFLSEMGNPHNDSKHFIELKTVNAPDIEQVIADKNSNANDFTCRNMILGIRYEFFYARMLIGSIANQALIKESQIEFGTRLDLKFKLDKDGLKVPIYVDVMFYDFGKLIGNSATTTKPWNRIIIVIMLLSMLIRNIG